MTNWTICLVLFHVLGVRVGSAVPSLSDEREKAQRGKEETSQQLILMMNDAILPGSPRLTVSRSPSTLTNLIVRFWLKDTVVREKGACRTMPSLQANVTCFLAANATDSPSVNLLLRTIRRCPLQSVGTQQVRSGCNVDELERLAHGVAAFVLRSVIAAGVVRARRSTRKNMALPNSVPTT
jgi:hypothetical protein